MADTSDGSGSGSGGGGGSGSVIQSDSVVVDYHQLCEVADTRLKIFTDKAALMFHDKVPPTQYTSASGRVTHTHPQTNLHTSGVADALGYTV